MNIPANITLADASFAQPGPIDVLIGADLFWGLLCIGQIRLGSGLPVLQKTVFGWVISGPINTNNNGVNTFCNFSKNEDVQNQLAKFWILEECNILPCFSKEEKMCEEHFKQNTKRNENGRFIVTIPLKDSLEKLGDSKQQVEKRFLNLEKRLNKNPEFKSEYIKFMREYRDLGHMNKVSDCNTVNNCYYMPHHGVWRQDSTTTRLRVVFDGSAMTSTGVSFNDLQMVGPTIQSDLLSILLRFRIYSYAVSADIAKMYRQILITPEQQSLQRILWRENSSDPLCTYELKTVTYGTSSAPFLAIRSLFQLGIDCENSHPEVSQIIKNNFYVDDVLFGADSVKDASRLRISLYKILNDAGFELRKFHSNSNEVIEEISLINNGSTLSEAIEICPSESTKTLGLKWLCANDKLVFNIGSNAKESRVTKRIILSNVGKFFDPLGLVSPAVILAKILMQKLWLERLSWDESVPHSIHTEWIKFRDEIPFLKYLDISRHVVCNNPKFIELHCFSDASEQAYGACIYVRSIDSNNQPHVRLMCSKTKVAPLKVITVPRLELCGAVMSARLAKKVELSLEAQLNNVTFWTDSTIVLGWLKMMPSSLKTFVANRVCEIQELSNNHKWKHVPTKDNPADIASRGMLPSQLINCKQWWYGPEWLLDGSINQPDCLTESLPEVRTITLISKPGIQKNPVVDVTKFSSILRLKRTMAYIFRFVHNCRNSDKKWTGPLSVQELENAFTFLLKQAQTDDFSSEVNLLSEGHTLSSKSKLFNLNPFVDNLGLLRVGGRLSNADFNENKKHPIIISAKHHLSKLIFKFEHVKLLHIGPQALLNHIRETLWTISGRNLAKLTVRQCVVCFRHNPKPISIKMGDIPKRRLQISYPFQTCGVDYAGPFLIKDRRGRGCKITKCYLALFVCFSIKAVHLELVSDLSSNNFLLALKRFINRRGKPERIYSDNGTNFVGAHSELEELAKFLKNDKNKTIITDFCANDTIEWRFIPVNSPHFEGLWEAGVKSSKFHLKRVIGKTPLTFEELYTIFTHIEAILNSRPLSPLSSDPNDLNPLTPAHFLIGRRILSVPEPNLTDIPMGPITISNVGTNSAKLLDSLG